MVEKEFDKLRSLCKVSICQSKCSGWDLTLLESGSFRGRPLDDWRRMSGARIDAVINLQHTSFPAFNG
jgi:hypothetical protein